jgi:Zn finger protein HypA/HybF involved in hydrogenase expression
MSGLDGFPLHCGHCGGLNMEVMSGEELEVVSLDVEQLQPTTTTGGRVHGDC